MIYEITDQTQQDIKKERSREKAALLFADSTDTSILSCLQNVMGKLYVDDRENPNTAMALIRDFCFLAGKEEEEFLLSLKSCCPGKDFFILVPQRREWEAVIEDCLKDKVKKVTRYEIKKEGDIFDRKRLQEVVESLPGEYELKLIDEKLYRQCKEIFWCKDWVAQYESYELYKEYGLGVAILKGEEIVAGASSYSGYKGGIEIEIDTRQDYRRRGLAYVSGAKLILECLKRGWYPSWDAQNQWSAALAEKLGYHYNHTYTAYEFCAG